MFAAGSERMRIDSSGNVGIGTSSPFSPITVVQARQGNDVVKGAQLLMTTATTVSDRLNINFSMNGVTNRARAAIGAVALDSVGGYNCGLAFYTRSAADSSELAISDERMRLDSNGNLLVGTTTATGKTTIVQAANSYGSDIRCNSGTFSSVVLNIGADRNTTDGTYSMIQATRYGAATCFIVRDSGNVLNTNNSYGAISDIKLKENITDASPKLADLMQVQVRNYNLIGETTKQIGVVAQELETVFPAMVDESPDRDEEGNDLGTTTKSVKYSVFVPMLVKAIQEQQALIQDLTNRLAALEAK
jgi:hypothetical protein